jgi:hypothetical protein
MATAHTRRGARRTQSNSSLPWWKSERSDSDSVGRSANFEPHPLVNLGST